MPEVWKYIDKDTVKAKHLFLDKEEQPVCRATTKIKGDEWAFAEKKLRELPECKICLRASGKSTVVPLKTENYTWKYVASLSSSVVHAFGKEATKPFCGIDPPDYGSYWLDDKEEVSKRKHCSNCAYRAGL